MIKSAHELMQLDTSVPNKNVVIVAPTHTSVTDIYYNLIMYVFGLAKYATKSSSSLGRIWLPRRTEIRLVSAAAIERVRGTGIYFAVADEIDTWAINRPVDAWDAVIHAAGRSRWSPKNAARYKAPRSFMSSVIGSSGGLRSLYQLSRRELEDSEYKSYSFDYTESPYLDPREIEKAMQTMDLIKFRQEYGAQFEEGGSRVYYAFDEKKNILENNPAVFDAFHKMSPEIRGITKVGIDFNIGIQACCIGHVIGDTLIITADSGGMTNTEELAEGLYNQYGVCDTYPDPTGRARKTSAPIGVTDLHILQYKGHNVYARRSSPPIIDSVCAVNGLCCNAAGVRRLFVSKKAKRLINSLICTQWADGNPDMAVIDKSAGVEHWSDGLRYMIEYLFPVRGVTSAKRGFNY